MIKSEKKGSLRMKRFLLKVLCTVLAVILAGMIGITVFVQQLMGGINRADPEGDAFLFSEELEQLLPEKIEEALDPEGDSQETGSLLQNKDVINILLIGQDRRPGEERARSDAMILCTIHKKTKQLTMTSILRDLYVQIPGYEDNRINAAYAFGGMKLLQETLEKNFGIRVNGTVEVDFSQFADIVDLLGGVTLDIRGDEARVINEETGSSLSEGSCLLNGKQALTYSRIRSLDADGDFSRTNRQRKVMSAVLETYKSKDLKTMLSLVDDILPMITTDMSNLKIIAYGLELFPKLADMTVVSQRIPADGTYTDQMIRGMSVLVADMDAARQMLEEIQR